MLPGIRTHCRWKTLLVCLVVILSRLEGPHQKSSKSVRRSGQKLEALMTSVYHSGLRS